MRTAISLMVFGVLIARLCSLVSPDTPETGQDWLFSSRYRQGWSRFVSV